MLIWLFVVIIMVIGLTILILSHGSKVRAIERFQNTSGSNSSAPSLADFLTSISGGPVTSSSLNTTTTTFTTNQANYGQNILGKEVLTNAVMPNYSNAMTTAVNQPDIYLNTPEDIIVRNLETDNNSQFTAADIQWCKSAKMPSNLPPHVKGASVGCGWYYISNPNMTSSGALGQSNGPIYPNGPNNDGVNGIPHYGNGQWIWDLALAEQLEEIKNCARIKSCIAIDAPSVNGVCGFCPPSGVAIPVEVDGTEKYPKALTIGNITAPAAVCNTTPVMHAASCPVPAAAQPPLITPQGINCGTYGYPSSDYSIRLYSKNDCEANLNGTWSSDGQCLMQDGDSFSAKCAPLNGIKPTPPGPTICTPDINGKLSTACLVSLAKAIGYTSQGSIIQMLQTGSAPGQLDKVAIQIVTGQNASVPAALYKGGVMTVQAAITAYDNIYSLIKGGSSPQVQQAAMWLCIGTNSFDPCDLPDATPGPFFAECVQQQWRVAGCQPGGTDYPSQQSTLDQINTLTWGKVKSIFMDTYNAMASTSDPVQQDVAVLRCLGINTKRTMPAPCVGISQNGLVLNLDSAAFGNTAAKNAYTMSGNWTSAGGLYIGPLTASGTRVTDTKGVQFDGTTVLGSPNLLAQVLALPYDGNLQNAPPPATITSPPSPTNPGPILETGFLPIGDIGMGVNSTEQHSSAPFFSFNADRSGWQPVLQQLSRDIANGIKYQATITGNNSGINYTFDVTQCADGSSWAGWIGNPNEVKPNPILFVQDSALKIVIQKYIPPVFDALMPIVSSRHTWGDCGMPSGEGHLGIWTNGNPNVAGQYYTGICVAMYLDPKTSGALQKAVYTPEPTSQSFNVTFTTDNGAVWNGGTLTGIGSAFGNQYAWNLIFQRTDGSGNGPGGGTLAPQYQKTPSDASWWNSLMNSGAPYWVTVNISVDSGVMNVIETRELWINPIANTCEILAILNGPTYTTSYTEMALYNGNLMIALNSVEKGYTFFTAGKVPIGQWSHIVHVYKTDGTNEVYINGAGPVSPAEKLTRKKYNGYFAYSLGGGSATNPLSQTRSAAMPFQGEIGAFRTYNVAFGLTDVQNNLNAAINTYVNQVQLATKNDPNALAMAAGQFYAPSLGPAINYQPSPKS